MLHQLYNPAGISGGHHVMAGDTLGTPWTYTGTTTTPAAGLGLISRSLAPSATMSGTFSSSTAFTVHFTQGPTAGSFTVAVDGGGPVTVTPNASGTDGRHDGTYTTPSVSQGSHSIVITAVGTAVVNGVYVHNGDEASGVQLYTSGQPSTTSASWAGATGVATRIGALAPGLVMIVLGSNDFATGMDPATFKSNIETIISEIKLATTPDPAFLLVGSYRRLDVPLPAHPYADYTAAMAAVAVADSTVAVVDISAMYPTSQMADVYGLLDADDIHQTDRGHSLMADLIMSTLDSPVYTPPVVSSSADSVFAPTDVAQLVSWWKADALSLSDANPVSTWPPTAGLENSALTQTGSNRPTYRTSRINGLPSVAFASASSQSLDTGAWITSRAVPNTVFTAFRYGTITGNLYSGRSGVFNYAGLLAGKLDIGTGGGGGVSTEADLDNDWHVLGAVYNGAATALYLDGRRAVATGTTSTGASANLPGLRMGSNSSGSGAYLDGEIAELVVYDAALTPAEVAQVMSYLGTKYGLTIL